MMEFEPTKWGVRPILPEKTIFHLGGNRYGHYILLPESKGFEFNEDSPYIKYLISALKETVLDSFPTPKIEYETFGYRKAFRDKEIARDFLASVYWRAQLTWGD